MRQDLIETLIITASAPNTPIRAILLEHSDWLESCPFSNVHVNSNPQRNSLRARRTSHTKVTMSRLPNVCHDDEDDMSNGNVKNESEPVRPAFRCVVGERFGYRDTVR